MKQFFSVFFSLVIIITPAVFAEGAIDSTERLRDIQQVRNITIIPEQRDGIILQCTNGKTRIVVVQSAADSAIKKRLTIYSEIQKELKAMELRMTKQGADASEIDLLIGKMQQDIDDFTQQARYSVQLAEDITTIDCATSPELYKAAIDEYMETRKGLQVAAMQLKTTILESPNTTFLPMVKRLKV